MKIGGTDGVNFNITKKDPYNTGNNIPTEYYTSSAENFLEIRDTSATGVSKWLNPTKHRTVAGAYLEYSYDAYEADNSIYNIKVKPNDTLPYDFLRSNAPVKLNYKFNFNKRFKLYDVKYSSNLSRYTAENSVYARDIIAIRPSPSGIYIDAKDTFPSLVQVTWSGSGTVYTFNYDTTASLSTENYGIAVYNSKNNLTLSSRLNISTAKILDVVELDVIADYYEYASAKSRYSNKTLFTKKYDVPNDMIAILPIREIALGGNANRANYTFDYVYSLISLNNSTVTVKQVVRTINYVNEFGSGHKGITWEREPALYRIFHVSVTPDEVVYRGQRFNNKVMFAVIDLSSFGNSHPLYTLPSKFGS